MHLHYGGHTFEIQSELIDPPSPGRPDELWSYVDPAGHRHQWVWPDGRRVYQPNRFAAIPTCSATQHTTVVNGREVQQLVYQCLCCGAPVNPGRVGGTLRRSYSVNGTVVSEAEFRRLMAEAGLPPASF